MNVSQYMTILGGGSQGCSTNSVKKDSLISRIIQTISCLCSHQQTNLATCFIFLGHTSSNRTGVWSRHVFALIFPPTQQSHAFSISLRTSPIAASGATNVKNDIRFVRQCKSTLYLIVLTVSHLVPVIHLQPPQAPAPVTSVNSDRFCCDSDCSDSDFILTVIVATLLIQVIKGASIMFKIW